MRSRLGLGQSVQQGSVSSLSLDRHLPLQLPDQPSRGVPGNRGPAEPLAGQVATEEVLGRRNVQNSRERFRGQRIRTGALQCLAASVGSWSTLRSSTGTARTRSNGRSSRQSKDAAARRLRDFRPSAEEPRARPANPGPSAEDLPDPSRALPRWQAAQRQRRLPSSLRSTMKRVVTATLSPIVRSSWAFSSRYRWSICRASSPLPVL